MSCINLIEIAQDNISDQILESIKFQEKITDIDPTSFKFETPPDPKLGHLAFACFPLAKKLQKAPPKIAIQLAEIFKNSEFFEKVVAVGPYLNFYYNPKFLVKNILEIDLIDKKFGKLKLGDKKQIMIEFSSPNTNKPLHLGHARNNFLGASLSNIFELAGYKVVKANLINDRGIHICKSMLAYQKWGNDETPQTKNIKSDKLVGEYYVLYDKKAKETPELVEEASQMLENWEKGDKDTIDLWEKMNNWVLEGFAQSYQRMGISFDRFYFESETYKGGKRLVYTMLEKGLCYKEDNGAIAIDLEDENLGKKILLRGNGTSMYITQDIHTTTLKFKNYPLDSSFFVVGNEQDNHFRVLFSILKKFGFQWADKLEHISYGMITLPDGKMKSREGTVVDLDDLMDETRDLAMEEIKLKKSNDSGFKEDDWKDAAEAIGQAAIKFFVLKTNSNKDIQFDPKESVSFDGMTGPYLQYTYARICSLFRKFEDTADDDLLKEYDWNPDEIYLMVFISKFPEIIKQATKERNPAVICNYIYDLCRLYNKFYYEYPIVKAEDKVTVNSRIYLSHSVRSLLYIIFKILGITPLEEM